MAKEARLLSKQFLLGAAGILIWLCGELVPVWVPGWTAYIMENLQKKH
ncbi:hypothetical protein RWE15_05380 [Virgibacillus halophilus]|uniref:Uncharacterized protein n=1 Tax=Tigheibacillus halophilus TaxID=361280 RepID=A0ABU5C3W5_9BACI|nr:hypothetical protein [Virgibacillus halophilus]